MIFQNVTALLFFSESHKIDLLCPAVTHAYSCANLRYHIITLMRLFYALILSATQQIAKTLQMHCDDIMNVNNSFTCWPMYIVNSAMQIHMNLKWHAFNIKIHVFQNEGFSKLYLLLIFSLPFLLLPLFNSFVLPFLLSAPFIPPAVLLN